ncbi:DAN domain family member 5 [Syngnathoides biaculeatus]|uniref:DAN domain family member 5 n=1 Tax=Syngnathoides biaculeatus TaxID=300417 RepID=UPI002ADE149C|nr:DAN domain family member 5 [Syngnathoides biaculeatus]
MSEGDPAKSDISMLSLNVENAHCDSGLQKYILFFFNGHFFFNSATSSIIFAAVVVVGLVSLSLYLRLAVFFVFWKLRVTTEVSSGQHPFVAGCDVDRCAGIVAPSSRESAASFPFPRNILERFPELSKTEFESSGGGLAGDPVRGLVRVVQLDPRSPAQSGLFGRRSQVRSSGPAFPAFLSQGRPGPAPKAPVSPLHRLEAGRPAEVEHKKRRGLHMWQRAIDKGNKMAVSLPANLKDAKQTCAAVPFVQRVTAEGCSAVTLHNKLCFGQCSSLFVPADAEPTGKGSRQRPPCSRCAPSEARAVTVPLRCGAEVRHRRVTLVEECKCETGREDRNAEGATPHLGDLHGTRQI